jgi:hypothetical protein
MHNLESVTVIFWSEDKLPAHFAGLLSPTYLGIPTRLLSERNIIHVAIGGNGYRGMIVSS